MLKQNKHCPYCNAKMVIYCHRINQGLMDALFKLYNSPKYTANISKIMTHNQIANFQKLKYWELVEKEQESGVWKMTYKGVEFVQGRVIIPEKIWTFRGKVVAPFEENVKKIYFYSYVNYRYDRKDDYINNLSIPLERENQSTLFNK